MIAVGFNKQSIDKIKQKLVNSLQEMELSHFNKNYLHLSRRQFLLKLKESVKNNLPKEVTLHHDSYAEQIVTVFDIEGVTDVIYDRFNIHHKTVMFLHMNEDSFQKFIEGIKKELVETNDNKTTIDDLIKVAKEEELELINTLRKEEGLSKLELIDLDYGTVDFLSCKY